MAGVEMNDTVLAQGHEMPVAQIKQEIEEDDDMEEEDSEDDEENVIKPAIENILSTSEESEESVSEFEEDEEVLPLPPHNNGSSSSSTFNNNHHQFHHQQGMGARALHHQGQGFPSRDKFADGEPRKKREAFTLQQKLEVLKFLQTHSVNATSRFYKVDPKSIRLWRSQKTKIEQTVQEELLALQQQGELDGVTPRKRISGAGRKKRADKVIVEIEENPNKRHRRTIKLSDKVEIIRLIEHGQTQSDVARSLGISQSTVQTIWSNKPDILERNLSPKKKRKNLHWKKYSSIDQALFNWFRQCRDSGVPVDGKMVLDKSIEFAEYYKQPEFKAQAQRWVDMFKRRHNLSDLDRQERLQMAAAAAAVSLDPNQHQHLQQLMNPQQHQPHPHNMTHANNHHDLVPDFDLSSLPSLMAGLYPLPQDNAAPPSQPLPPSSSSSSSLPQPPSFNSHLPAVPVMGGPVTTCDAMKYVELTRNWITATFGDNEEVLNNHLNAIENAILKRRMTEMLTPNSAR